MTNRISLLTILILVVALNSHESHAFDSFCSPLPERNHQSWAWVSEDLNATKSVFLFVSDKVEDGCWHNARSVEANTSDYLERLGLKVYVGGAVPPELQFLSFEISASGWREGVCIGDISIRAEIVNFTKARETGYIRETSLGFGGGLGSFPSGLDSSIQHETSKVLGCITAALLAVR